MQFFDEFEQYQDIVDLQIGLRDQIIAQILTVIFGEIGKQTIC